MARKLQRKTAKYYETETVDNYNLNYEYESLDNAVPLEIRVTGTKKDENNQSLLITVTKDHQSVNFSSGAKHNSVVVDAVLAECEKINKEVLKG